MKLLAFALILLLCGRTGVAADKLSAGKRLFIDKMPQDLDSYLKAEIIKQKIPLTIVRNAAEADYVMAGTSTEEERRKWHEGWLTAERDKTAGSVEIIDATTKVMLWAGEAGDRSLWWGSMARGGHRKVAARLVEQLKKYVQHQRTGYRQEPGEVRSTSATVQEQAPPPRKTESRCANGWCYDDKPTTTVPSEGANPKK